MASIQTQMISSYSIFLSILLTTIHFSKVNSLDTTSFSIDKFVKNQPNLIFQRDSYVTKEKLKLTTHKRDSLGRALYSAPIKIWDSETGNVANFQTNFTFVIDAQNSNDAAYGLAFFIAPRDTKPAEGGRFLGVFNSTDQDKSPQTVAVVFETLQDRGNPRSRHIGINVNSIIPQNYEPWDFKNGEEAKVVIAFNGTTDELSVSLTYPNSNKYDVHDVVHLKDVVPEWVRVGFSATTGSNYEAHDVLSWSFRSELNDTSSSKQVADA